jgi:hypothetical protein
VTDWLDDEEGLTTDRHETYRRLYGGSPQASLSAEEERNGRVTGAGHAARSTANHQ